LEQAEIYMKYSVVATTRSRQDFRREKREGETVYRLGIIRGRNGDEHQTQVV
jgi:hypothetical protein